MQKHSSARGRRLAKEAALGTGRAFGHIVGLALRTVLTVLLIGVCTAMLFVVIFAAYVKNSWSDELDISIGDFRLNQTSIIYALNKSTGEYEVLEQLSGLSGDLQFVNYEDLNPYFEKAAVAIEDHRFYEHYGVDWYRTFGAFYTVFLSNSDDVFGGSTLTQQLIKNLTTHDDVTVKRKLLEIFQALQMEKNYSKEEIVEAYLNRVFFGNRCKGVQAASLRYFGKDQSELTAAECAAIIGITNNPSGYNPYYYPSNTKKRQESILAQMLDQGFLSEAEYETAMAQELVYYTGEVKTDEKVTGTADSVTSWYVDAVIEDVIRDLMELKGLDYDTASDLLFSAGYRIYTCMDMGVQDIIDDVYSTVENLPAGYRKSSTQDLQSAIIVMDPETGDILGMAGGLGKKTVSRGFNFATQMERSPGSTIKPLASYSLCLEKGLVMPWTIFDDSDFVQLNGTDWYPNNDDMQNDGGVTLRYALQVSINTVAAQMIDMLTPRVSYDHLVNELGMTHLVDGVNGFSDATYAGMALGQLSYGETVREMCQAYTVLSNNGIYTEGRTYSRIEDAHGALVYENVPESHAVLSETTSYYMTEMLCNAANRGTGWLSKFGNMAVAGKSGGSNDWNDRWYIAYTPYLLASCWTGYEIPENMGSSNPATGMWKQVMERVHAYLGYEDTAFPIPPDMKRVTVCCDTGLLATEACEHEIRGDRTMTLYMREDAVPTSICPAHVFTNLCKDSMDKPGDSCPTSSIASFGVLDPSRCEDELTLPDFYLNGEYPRKPVRQSWQSDAQYQSVLVSLEEKLKTKTPYTLDALVSCRVHSTDPISGWKVEYPHGYLIDPVTGIFYDRENDTLVDPYSRKLVDFNSGYIINGDGTYIIPSTGQKVALTEEELAAFYPPKYTRPPGYGSEPPPPPPETGSEGEGTEPDLPPETGGEAGEGVEPGGEGGETGDAPAEDGDAEASPGNLFYTP